ncbi:pumilio RNA-binding family [Nematocida displodere]|uniref:Pumilio RNA-binding family n=1 Tax=Nematocida displodere TaxID=1805483 RepID=A0A177EHA2_9MICR|nr:pumilio RNA-binding family [Nematocida displodere]
MFEESSQLTKKARERAGAPEHFRKQHPTPDDTKAPTPKKEPTDIIADAFNPIECTPWKVKNLIDQIEEDHPSHKSTEYVINSKIGILPPIGKGLPDRNKARYMSLGQGAAEGLAVPAAPTETKKQQFFEEMHVFARKRGISVTTTNIICAISKDQEGSRFIQKKLDAASAEEIEQTFQEIKKSLSELITDLFGNYVVQKLLEIGTGEQRKEILATMESNIITLALHMYGCRVVQKALECKDINKRIVEKLKGHVIELVCDQNGNHVIQKCVECVDSKFVIKEFEADAVNLSRHRYGCRVIQRIFENSKGCSEAIDTIINNAKTLVEDQYGNYVIQHILEKGTDAHKKKIIADLADKVAEHSTHKFASNVMEKCVVCGTPENRKYMLGQLLKAKAETGGTLVSISCDKFGNYVVQRMLDVLTGKEKETLVQYLKNNLPELKKSTYAKCIISKLAVNEN